MVPTALTQREQGLRAILADPRRFSQHVIGLPLRPYQTEPLTAIVDSALNRRGLTFTVMMSRQAGKNELSAQLEAYLLTLFHRRGGQIVKAAPTFKPQIVNSMLRLQGILETSELTRGRWAPQWGYTIRVGRARILFFSAGPDSQIVGATASLLLEIDEAQDVDEAKYLKDLRPMGASTNVTTVLYGTAWTADTLLEHQRQENLRLEALDGIRRDFVYPWHTVAEANPDYGRFVQAEIDRMGEAHPLVRTQYLLDVLDSTGRFLSETQLAQLRGAHPRLRTPEPNEIYVAGLDLAGADEDDPENALQAIESRRDLTSLTLARVTWVDQLRVKEPNIEIVHQVRWLNVRHRDLFAELVSLLKLWRCTSITVDASGIGAGVASFLVGALGAEKVHPFVFRAVSKSDLGYQLLTTVNSGRLSTYADDGSVESTELWTQARLAKSQLHTNQRLSWQVDERDGHDDALVSAALTVEAAQHSRPRVATGRPVNRTTSAKA